MKSGTFVPHENQNVDQSKTPSTSATEVGEKKSEGFDFNSKPGDHELWGPPSGLKIK